MTVKNFILSLALVLVCTACNSRKDAFATFAGQFGKTAAFACVEVGDRHVLLVSHEVFGNDEEEGLNAVAASIFALDPDGKIVSLGSVRSQGTLYPVSVLDGRLMVAGHRFVYVYDIRGEEPELELVCHGEGDCESPELQELFGMFELAETVIFHKNPNR